MESALVEKPVSRIPPGLEFLFKDPPLIGDEKREDYENLLRAIVDDIKPGRSSVVWLLVKDVTDLTWEIERDKSFKSRVILIAQSEMASRLLAMPKRLGMSYPMSESEEMDNVARQWASNPEAQQRINNELAKKGYDASYLLTSAMKRAAPHIEAIDRRIATAELRRMIALKGIKQFEACCSRSHRGEIYGSRGIG